MGDPNPLPNTATITCDVAGTGNQASDSAGHSVDLIDPAIEVTKTGPGNLTAGALSAANTSFVLEGGMFDATSPAVLLAVHPDDGTVISQVSLETQPVFDGLVVANGNVYMATVDAIEFDGPETPLPPETALGGLVRHRGRRFGLRQLGVQTNVRQRRP